MSKDKTDDKKETGGAAFPQQVVNINGANYPAEDWGCGGMTLRDYFAAKAIQGTAKYGEYPTDLMIGQLVGNAYKIADTMLKERDKEE